MAMRHRAWLACRLPPWLRRWRTVLARGRLHRRGSAERGKSGVAAEPLGVVTGGDQQDRGHVDTDARGRPQGGVGSGGEDVELSAQGVELDGEALVLAGQGPQSSLGGLKWVDQFPGPEAGAALHPIIGVQRPKDASQLLRGGDHQISDLVGDAGPGIAHRGERHPKSPDGLHDPGLGLGRSGSFAVERGTSGRFGIGGVALASPPAGLAVGPVDLHHLDVLGGQVTGQAGTVGAGALHADPLELAEVAHPAHQPPVAGRRRRKPGRSQDSADIVDDRRYVDVLVGVDAADDSALLIGHDWLPFFARQWGIAPPAGTGGQDTQGADKAPDLFGWVQAVGVCSPSVLRASTAWLA